MSAVVPELVLRMPLQGVQLVEASAGTGKTFALTAWWLRLVMERGASPSQLLTVTFTRAATAELRERIRRRLRGAEQLLAGREAVDDEQRQTKRLLDHAHALDIEPGTVRTRVRAALLQLDEAAVFTIHGFCQRALREFGFLAGALGEEVVIDDARAVWTDVAADLWRAASAGEDGGYEHMASLWSDPDALAARLPDLCNPVRQLLPEAGESDIAAWLHALRERAMARFDDALNARGERTQDQLIQRVWQASAQPRFATALARRWPVLLVDEFQDTEPRQWDIFRRMHEAGDADSGGLLGLIGDPKQAIYGFRGGDLPTYVDARKYARARGGVDSLDTNFRSRPSLLAAVETLFTQHDRPFGDREIDFQRVHAARADDESALQIDGRPAPALTVHWLPSPGTGKARRRKDDDVESAIATTVAEIARLLASGTVRSPDGAPVPLHAGAIAVLVRSNKQVVAVRGALAEVGIAAATQTEDSVFASIAAEELARLLEAFAHPADPARIRAALATRVVGLDAAAIDGLDNEGVESGHSQVHWQERFEAAGATWRQHGPLPALLPLLGEASARLLGEPGGTRLLTDALHLAELLQAQAAHEHGPLGLLRWHARQRARRQGSEDSALRLDTDTDAIHVATLHKSKGLEYPVVFLPFAAFADAGGNKSGVRCLRLTSDDGAANYLFRSRGSGSERQLLLGNAAQHDAWLGEEVKADREERLRLFYVGLTRARLALHLVWGYTSDSNDSAMHWLLHGSEKAGRKNDALQPGGMRTVIEQLAGDSGGAIVVQPMSAAPPATPVVPPQRGAATPPEARIARRILRRGAGQYSFSGLRAHHSDVLPPRGADDETGAVTAIEPSPAPDPAGGGEAARELGGAEFGNAVHDALEAADFAQWHGCDAAPPATHPQLREALVRHGLPQTPAAIAQVGGLVARALNALLPDIGTLAQLPASQRVAEMEFHFRLGATRLPELYSLLHAHGYPRDRATLHAGAIEGLMHGYIDLLYRSPEGAHYVLDYKTNRLRDYSASTCAAAVRASDYDLQYLIYLVATQRWLRLRLGEAYDPVRHLGGAVYLFLRGLQPGEGTEGMHVDRPPQALVDALDALLAGPSDGARA
ncbi:hypothetical protein BH23PSE2_BH23PSE2_05770 [soil metagenome]